MKDMQYRRKQFRAPGILLAGALFTVATLCVSTPLLAAAHRAAQPTRMNPETAAQAVQPDSAVARWLDGSLRMADPGEPRVMQHGSPAVILPPATEPLVQQTRRYPTTAPSAKNACHQATRFVREAAVARDAGMNPGMFLATLERDLRILLSRPPAQRWLVHSEMTAGLIRFAAVAVFNRPQPAASHAQSFQRACVAYQRASRRPGARRAPAD